MVAGPFIGLSDVGKPASVQQARKPGDAIAVQRDAQGRDVDQNASRSRMCRRRGTASAATIAARASSGMP